MPLTARAIALNGIGFEPLSIAAQGFAVPTVVPSATIGGGFNLAWYQFLIARYQELIRDRDEAAKKKRKQKEDDDEEEDKRRAAAAAEEFAALDLVLHARADAAQAQAIAHADAVLRSLHAEQARQASRRRQQQLLALVH